MTNCRVSKAEIKQYQDDGVVLIRGAIDAQSIADLRLAVEANIDQPGQWANEYVTTNQGRFFDDYVNWQRIEGYKKAALSGVLPSVALALMGTRQGRFFHEHVLVKEPGTAQKTPWHHDDPYYGIDATQNVSLWVPLDDVPDEIALRAIKGSHNWNKRFVPRRFIDESPYVLQADGFSQLPSPELLDSSTQIEDFPAKPGDIVAFHFRTLHCARATEKYLFRRRVVSFRYTDINATWATRPWRTSPPLDPNGLKHGDRLDDQRFPIISSQS